MPVIISRPASGGGGGGVTPVTGSVSGFATRSDLNAQSLSVSPSGGTAPYSYAWSSVRPDGTSSTSEFDVTNAASVSFTPERVGLYSVSCVITDSAGSPQNLTVSATAKVGSDLSVSLGGFATTTDLAAQSLTSTPTNGTGGYSYAWTVTKPDGTSGAALLSSTTDQNPTLTPTAAGLHSVSVTVTDSSSQTATASASRDLGTGVVSAPVIHQIQDFTGWTKFAGANTDNSWMGPNWNQYGTSTPGTGGADISISGGVITLSDAGEPSSSLNQPFECFGYVSPSSLLSSIDTTVPGTWNLFIEVTSDQTLTDARTLIGVAFVSRSYDGSTYATGTGDQGFAGIVYMPEVSAGQDKTWNFSGFTNGSLTAGGSGNYGVNARVIFSAMASGRGEPSFMQSQLYDGTTPTNNETRIATINTTGAINKFSSDNDTRLAIYMGRLSTGPGGASSFSVKVYWSYTKAGT